MTIDWNALLLVAGVSLAFGIGVVTVFSLGLLSLAGGGRGGDDTVHPSAAGRLGAGVCFAVCAAAVLFGLWLLVPQFHQ